ncbi:MAG: tryptophan--tRNA ligase [Elusimicrobia bacterium]|nr:tryptophan--tRNA ligase [Elusimicrobiota bacterium]
MAVTARGRVLSGMRPSGQLHLGNYVGALAKWVELQETHECLFMVADWHALTTEYAATTPIEGYIEDMVLDWLAVGVDPSRSVIFRQSWVKQHAELQLLLSMITPVTWLERCPTYKEQLSELRDRELNTHGFLGYPVLQAADILIYKATQVPVGEDQLPHLELTREIARRFNYLYGALFPEPQAILSSLPKLPGLDGRKMSKSYGNTILLSDPLPVVREKANRMFTDPQKIKATDLGHPEGCVVFAHHRVFTSTVAVVEQECRQGLRGCVACKGELADQLAPRWEVFQTKRAEISRRAGWIHEILREGSRRASALAQTTLEEVRAALHLSSSPPPTPSQA